MNQQLIPDEDFTPPEDTPERILVVVLVDASASMHDPSVEGGPRKIDQLIVALEQFLNEGMHFKQLPGGGIEPTRLEFNGELAVAAFGNREVRWLQLAPEAVEPESHFYFVRYITGLSTASRSQLVPNGNTPMAEAIIDALNEIERRKQSLVADGLIHECCPNVYLLTDGAPSTDITAAAHRLRDEEAGRHALFFAFGTPSCNTQVMAQLAAEERCFYLGKRPLSAYLEFIDRSLDWQLRGERGPMPGLTEGDDGVDDAYPE